MGFSSVINLRRATEQGANVEQEAVAVAAAGLKYFHIPYDGSADPAVAEQFLDAITSEGVEPAFVHCAGGGRAATMWLIKRIAVDHWTWSGPPRKPSLWVRATWIGGSSPSNTRRPTGDSRHPAPFGGVSARILGPERRSSRYLIGLL